MTDALTLRRLDTDHESFATVYDHPEFGKIDVGRVNERKGNPDQTDKWAWCIRINSRPRPSFEGTATTMKAAVAAWKAEWPKFKAQMSEADWHDAKADQDHSQKRLMLFDASRLPGLTPAEREQLRTEGSRPGPASDWLLKLLARHKPGR